MSKLTSKYINKLTVLSIVVSTLQIIKIGNVACEHFGYKESLLDEVKFKQDQNNKKEADMQK